MKRKIGKILIVMVLFLALSVPLKALGMPGARSATNDSGDVFLGGNYIEVGISKGGSFGTSAPAPESFHSHATAEMEYRVGLLSDGDGWNVGNQPTTRDFFLPGEPEERWGVAYKIGNQTYQYFVADRMGDLGEYTIEEVYGFLDQYNTFKSTLDTWFSTHDETDPDYAKYQGHYATIVEAIDDLHETIDNYERYANQNLFEVRDASDIENGILKAIVTGVTPENVKIEITYSFGVNDKYYNTEVKIYNQGNKDITDTRFLRSFDPDQDAEIYKRTELYNGFFTYNKVLSNPNSSIEGSSKNFAMVVSRGSVTLDGFFFISFDNRARASRGVNFSPENIYEEGLWVDHIEGFPTSANKDSAIMAKENLNNYVYEDNAIALTFNLETIAKNQETTFSYISSLDPNVVSSMNNILGTIPVIINSYTDTKIEIEVHEGLEYSIDGGETWQDTGVFDNLKPNTEYTILSRAKATDNSEASEPRETLVTTKKAGPDAPSINLLTVTEDSAKVLKIEGVEYSIDGGETWQLESIFNELKPNTEYELIARYKETEDTMCGKQTNPKKFKTLEKEESNLDGLDNVNVSVEADDDVPAVMINKGLWYDAISEDEDVKDAVESGDNVEIKFVIQNSSVDEKTLAQIKESLKDGESIAFTIDATIKLYVNGDYVKDITVSSDKVKFILNIPSEYVKSGRKFYAIRAHINESGELEIDHLDDDDLDDATITIASDKFSSFSISYMDIAESNNTQTVLENPKTIDNVMTYVMMLFLSFIGMVSVKLFTKKRERNI